jgi:hypothetical protein
MLHSAERVPVTASLSFLACRRGRHITRLLFLQDGKRVAECGAGAASGFRFEQANVEVQIQSGRVFAEYLCLPD